MEIALRGIGKLRTSRHVAALFAASVSALGLRTPAALAQPDSSCGAQFDSLQSATTASDSTARRKSLSLCARRYDDSIRLVRLRKTEPEARRIVRMYFDIPEFHDEGRLAKDRETPGAELGPPAGIYASPFLHGFTRPAQIYEQGPLGSLAGIVVVDEYPLPELPPSYRRLGLKVGLNCVWLYVDPPQPGINPDNYRRNLHFIAHVSQPPADSGCIRQGEMKTLNVVAVRNTYFPHDTVYPAVARFDTDRLGRPILSFRCLNAFCEIGVDDPRDVRTPDALPRNDLAKADWGPKAAKIKQGRREVVKGWHDEQYLAVRDPSKRWRSSDIKAVLLPDTMAALYDSVDFHNVWQTVAVVRIDGQVRPASKYWRWGFRKGDNTVQFMFDTETAVWKARLLMPDGAPVPWSTMERVIHHDVFLPGTVRFRWTVADDGVWAPCGNACCKASDDG